MVDETMLIMALESRKRLVKTDAVSKPGIYAYAVLWTEMLAVLREMTGGEKSGQEESPRQQEV